MISIIKKYFDKKIDAVGLAWFRVSYMLILLFDVRELYVNSNLIFDPIPFYWASDINFKYLLIIWMINLVMLILGFYTKFNSILNYIFTVAIFSTLSQFEYHIYYVYSGVNFLVMFIPLSKVFSLDNLLSKLRNSELGKISESSRTTTVWSYWLIPFMGIGMVYLGSVFYKLDDPIWLNGMGLWWPASFPIATNISLPWLLDSEWLIKFLGYFALIFELVFVVIFWFKKLRFWVAVVGIIFHIGIFLFFPIPNFALAVAAIYLLCIPVGYWKFFAKVRYKSPLITVYYDGECPLCFRTRIFIEHFDCFHAVQFKVCQHYFESDLEKYGVTIEQALNDLHGIDKGGRLFSGFKLYRRIMLRTIIFSPIAFICYLPGVSHFGNYVYKKVASNRETYRCNEDNCVINFAYTQRKGNTNEIKLLKGFSIGDLKIHLLSIFLGLIIAMQLIVIYFSPFCLSGRKYLSQMPFVHESLNGIRVNFVKPLVPFTGITGHDVFLKSHLDHYNDAIRLSFVQPDGKEVEVPLIDIEGKPVGIVSGCVWANFTFRFMSPNVNSKTFLYGLKRYTSNWLEGQDNGLPYVFKVSTKKMFVPEQWETGIQARELNNHEWKYLGTITWKNKEFHYEGEIIDNIAIPERNEPNQ